MKKSTNFILKRHWLISIVILLVMTNYYMPVYADTNEISGVLQSSKTVNGTVVDTQGEALIGVNVTVPGSNVGTITDVEGNFQLTIPAGKNEIKVTYVGYQDQTITIGSKTTIRIIMNENSELLDEVVVVGYGTQKKVNLTGAVSTVSGEIFEDKGAVSNPLQALQGQVPGITVSRNSGAPGRESWNFKIRGESSKNSDGALVLIDGIPGSMDDINPDDIESISILKDASAAIYGARAAEGVVLVTTRRGRKQAPKITYKGNISLRKPGLMMEKMNMSQYAYALEEAFVNDGTTTPGSEQGASIFPKQVLEILKNPKTVDGGKWYNNSIYLEDRDSEYGFYDVDWNDALWGTAASHSHTLSVQGGSDHNAYSISLGFMYDDSMAKWGNDNSKRYNIRINDDLTINKRLSMGMNLSFDRRENVYPTYQQNNSSGQPAGSPVSTKDGKPFSWADSWIGNHWAAELGGDSHSTTNQFAISLQPTYKIIDGLTFVGNISFNTRDNMQDKKTNLIDWYRDNGDYGVAMTGGRSETQNSMYRMSQSSTYQNYSGYLEYKKTFQSHALGAMIGLSYERNDSKKFDVTAEPLTNQALNSLNVGDGFKATDEIRTWALGSYFGRLNYAYKDRYLLEVLGRYDGSSRFARGYKWQPFMGVSAGWRISEERWMKSNGIFQNLKLRVSYGETGHQGGIGLYDFAELITLANPSGTSPGMPIFGPSGSPSWSQSLYQSNTVSYDRKWEKVQNTNIGLDFTVLDGRLSGTLDYYWKNNPNMLVTVTYPSVLGATAPETNSGHLKTKGWEVSLNWRDRIGQVDYYAGFNISDDWNKLIKMENANNTGVVWNSEGKVTQYYEGYPLNTYWGFEAYKLIETEEERLAYKEICDLIAEPRIGDMMYNDINKDGVVNDEDVKYLGDQSIRLNYSFNMGVAWKGFDLGVIFQGVGRRTIFRSGAFRAPMSAWYMDQNAAFVGKWYSDVAVNYPGADVTPANLDPYAMPKLAVDGTYNHYNYAYSDAWYRKQNGAYLRMKNLTFGYTFPTHVIKKAGIERLRLYFSGNDLWEKTKITDGFDPEAPVNPMSNRSEDGPQGYGYPFARTYAFGIDITF